MLCVMKEERLWVADPKVIHQILQGSSHVFEKPRAQRQGIAVMMDRGLSWAEGWCSLASYVV